MDVMMMYHRDVVVYSRPICVFPVHVEVEPPRCSWRRVRVLGKGAYGVVYLAYSQSIQQPVAVKTSTLQFASFLAKELRIYKALDGCPEIARCFYDEISFERRSRFYNIVLEFASAGSLRDLIISRGSGRAGLPEPDVRAYTRMILKGLHYMHSRGFVHCDLKPENILAFAHNKLKLADFGLTREPGERTPTMTWQGRFRGTPTYMSPESVNTGVIGPKLDIWSLGCVVVNMVTGRCAWDWVFETGDVVMELKKALARYGASPKVPENMSEEGRDFLSKCFDRRYRNRWSAKMLLHHPFVSLGGLK